MFLRGILLLLGITLTVIGLTNIILYLNLLVNGYTFLEYVNFIIRRFECLSLIIGILLIYPKCVNATTVFSSFIKSSMFISPSAATIFVFLSSPNFSYTSSNSSLII